MIALNVTDGPHKGHVGHLLGYAVESGTEDFETAHWVLVLLMDNEAKLAAVRIEHLALIVPENALEGEGAVTPVVKL